MVEERKEPAEIGQLQENTILQVMNEMQAIDASQNKVNGQDLVKELAKKLENLDEVEREVIGKCIKIQEEIIDVREILKTHMNTERNILGCLRGTIDDYLKSFNP